MNQRLLILILTVASAAATDISAWLNASKQQGEALPFNWKVAAARWVFGALLGTGGGLLAGE